MRKLAIAAILLGLAAAVHAGSKPKKPALPPLAEKRPVVDRYHDTDVTDDYRWLENGQDPEVQAWSQAHAAWAQWKLESLPATKAITERLLAIDDAREVRYFPFRVGTTWYASKAVPGKSQPILVKMASVDDPTSAVDIFDVNALDPDGHTSVDFWVVSYDGTKLAVSMSKKGSEAGTLYIYDLATGKPLADEIPRVNGGTAGGSVAWTADSAGLYYTRYPAPGERPDADLHFYQQVWFHKLGTPVAQDSYAVGKEFPRIAEVALHASDDGKFLVARVSNGDGGEQAFWLLHSTGTWIQLSRFEDDVIEAAFGSDRDIYLLSIAGAPQGKILRVSLKTRTPSLAKATVAVKEGQGRISSFVVTQTRIFVASMVGGPSELRVYGLDGSGGEAIAAPPVSMVAGLMSVDAKTDEVLFAVASYLEPMAWFRYTPGGEPVRSALSGTSPVDFSPYEVTRVMVKSKDGTMVPLNLLHQKGLKKNGKNPTLLNAYGGYGISTPPRFSPNAVVWLEQGGVLAWANVRGGGEFGEAWHENGMLTRKQNVFDDFIACAEWLITEKVTSAKKLAIEGGSNGGLLMGAVLTQRPELFGAVVSWVGVYDMLRVESTPNGAFNVTEFGTVKDPAQFKALFAYSPVHNVKDGAKYPPLLLVTGENDPRVDAWHSRKFAARLLAAGAKDILLFTNPDAGHGVPQREARFRQMAYARAFALDRLGVKYKPVKAKVAAKAAKPDK